MDAFLDGQIRSRISIRLIAEQHIALSRSLADTQSVSGKHIGVIDMKCAPKNIIKDCEVFVGDLCFETLGVRPEVVLDGDVEAVFPCASFYVDPPELQTDVSVRYVPVHLEYIMTEILKNAFRATAEKHHLSSSVPPVRITISPDRKPAGTRPKFVSLRIRDEGGGVSKQNMEKIFSYAFTTAGPSMDDEHGSDNILSGILHGGNRMQSTLGTIAGLGYGLPMSRLYATYFGGGLELKSLESWGKFSIS